MGLNDASVMTGLLFQNSNLFFFLQSNFPSKYVLLMFMSGRERVIWGVCCHLQTTASIDNYHVCLDIMQFLFTFLEEFYICFT